MREALKRWRPREVRCTQKVAVARNASSTSQEYQSVSWDGHGAVSTYVRLLLKSTDQAPAWSVVIRVQV